jgi:transcriptional regulator with XRE-family HTH domain
MLSHTKMDMLTPMQLRAARALVGWSREELAEKAGIAAVTVRAFELLGADSKQSTILKMRRAIEAAGVELLDEDQTKGAGAADALPVKQEQAISSAMSLRRGVRADDISSRA